MYKIFSYDVKSNKKKTDKGVGVYFKGQNVESVLSSQGYFRVLTKCEAARRARHRARRARHARHTKN